MSDKDNAIKKIKPLLENLSNYNVSIDFDYDVQVLKSIMDYYESKKNFLSQKGIISEEHKYEYSKAFWICESVRMYLKEIAPKRLKRKKK